MPPVIAAVPEAGRLHLGRTSDNAVGSRSFAQLHARCLPRYDIHVRAIRSAIESDANCLKGAGFNSRQREAAVGVGDRAGGHIEDYTAHAQGTVRENTSPSLEAAARSSLPDSTRIAAWIGIRRPRHRL